MKNIEIRRFCGTEMQKHKLEEKRDKEKKHIPYIFLMSLAVICFMLLFAGVGVASATDYYVATTGNNAWSGLSPDTAWRTIAYAVSTNSPASAGDTIYVLDGTYAEGSNNIIFQKDGITLTAYNQESPNVIVDGVTKNPNDDVIRVKGRHNINISKLEIINGDNGIWIVDSTNIYVSDCEVHDTLGEGIAFLGGHHCTMENCIVHDCGWNQIQLAGPGNQGETGPVPHHFSVINCTVYNAGHSMIDLYGDMDYVTVKGCDAGIYSHQEREFGLRYFNCLSNTLHGSFHLDTPISDSVISNNTMVVDSVPEIIQFREELQNVTFRDNYMRGDCTANWMVDIYMNQGDLLFDHDDIKSDYGDYEFLIRGGTCTIRNQVASEYKVGSADGAIITVEYTDGRTFSVDGEGEYTTYTFSSGVKTINVFGEPSVGTISGTVTNTTGSPIEGAVIKANSHQTRTNSTGDYIITNLLPGNYTVTASKDGYYSNTTTAEILANQTTTLNFQLTRDTTPPVIYSNINISSITSHSAVISWDTDESSTSLVKYGTSSGSYPYAKEDTSYTTSHSITLTNLQPNTTYYFVVNSTDKANNSAQSSERSFKTKELSNIVYVATDGTGDYNCDGTDDQVEINQAISYINSIGGGTVHLKAGTYIISDSINLSSNLIFEGDGTEKTTIKIEDGSTKEHWATIAGEGISSTTIRNLTINGNKDNCPVPDGINSDVDAFHLYNSNNLTVENVKMINFWTDGVEFSHSSDSAVKDCKVIQGRHDGLRAIYSNNITFSNNYVYSDGTGNAGIRIYESSNCIIENNYFNVYGFGIEIDPQGGVPCGNNIYRDNYMEGHDGLPGIYIHGYNTEINNETFIRNIIGKADGHGIELKTTGSGKLKNIKLINNIFTNTKSGIYVKDGADVTNITAKNNIIVNNGEYGIYGSVLSSYNDVWGNSLGDYGGGASAGDGDISADPLFADPANGDFHLRSEARRWNGSAWVEDNVTSPCIDAGDPNDDYSKEPKPNGGRINMGAYGNTAEASKSPGENTPPVADPAGPYSGTEGIPLAFNGSGSYDPDGTIVSYEWDFGDGYGNTTTGTEASPTQTHTYAQNGNYTVTLTVTDNKGATDTKTTTAIIADTEPAAEFTATPTAGLAPLTVDFTDSSTSYDGITAWEWDFNGDGVTDSTEQNPSYSYNEPGRYTVSLTVHEADGDSATVTKQDYITVREEHETVKDYIWLEAEDADALTPDFEIASDASASNDAYIWIPEGVGFSAHDGIASYNIHVNTSGDYVIWGRVIASDERNNSFFVQVDNDSFEALWTINLSNSWQWDAVNHWGDNGSEFEPEIDPVVFNLSAGDHILEIKQREDGTKLDKLLITNNLSYVPQDEGNTIPPISSISGFITYACNETGLAGATVNLSLSQPGNGNETPAIKSTVTDSNGSYMFINVYPGTYNITASRRGFWSNSSSVTVTGTPASESYTLNLTLWLKGDLNNNGKPADNADVAKMENASIGNISPDWRYDLNRNGILADAGDLAMIKGASAGNIVLE